MRNTTPFSHRLLLCAYPRWFRAEFGGELLAHLAHERTERRYTERAWGLARFWCEAGTDAVMTGISLRAGGTRERWARIWHGRHSAGDGRRGGGGDRRVKTGSLAALPDAIRRDLRDALRALARDPGYALVFVVTLGLGIGVNTAMFSVVNAALLRPLPHDDGHRLVYLRHSARPVGIDNALFSVPEIDDYRRGAPSLAAVAEFSAMSFAMLGDDPPRLVRAGIVTGNYFQVMGLSAILGRAIEPEDDGEDAPPVVVLSDAYWRSTFGANPQIVGKTVEINALLAKQVATIVGVAEPAPPYPEHTDVYVNMATSPHHLSASMSHDRTHRMTEVFARLAPAATVESARTEVSAISARIHEQYPEAYDAGAGFEVTVTPLKTQLTSRARPTFLLLLGTASLVLVIACANLANLTLTRVLRRDHELAIRVSLGGSRAALRRALLVESLVLAGAGAVLGLLLATLALELLVAFAERFTARAAEIALDGSVFGFALLAALAASLFFTLLPPLPDGDHGGVLARTISRATAGSRARRAQRALVVAQIATSFVLLIAAGLLLRTVLHLTRVDPGFDTVQVLSMNIPVDAVGRTDAHIRGQYLEMLRDVRALPRVESAALTSTVPLAGPSIFTSYMEMDVEGHEPAPGAPTPRARFHVVSPHYFATMGIELLRGREFRSTDVEDAQKVVVLNESMARAYFGDRDPLGRHIAWTDDNFRFLGLGREWRTVVGVVADTRDAGLDATPVHTMYTPYQQVTPLYTGSLVVRVRGDASTVLPAVREVILDHDPEQAIVKVATIADLGNESLAPRRLNTALLGAFALLALVIAGVGIGGVLAFSVGSRTHELGVRTALGATRHQIWSGVLAEAAVLAGIGVALGCVGALFLTRFIAGLLVGVPALDLPTFVAVGLLLGSVAVLAAWAPAWRAAAVSPLQALASE
jgi:predicted permease